jgi:uncharacterized protein (TIGR02466 family)
MCSASADKPASTKRMNKDSFFPTQIYFTDIPGADELNEYLKKKIYAWQKEDPQGTFRTNIPQIGAWHSATDMQVRPEYNRLTAEIFEMTHGIYHDLGYDPAFEPVCDSMWVNINPKYSYNRHHTHPHALWSGVYYVQTPDNCGLLSFTDPRPQTQILPPYFDPQRRAAETWNEIHYQPQEGRLIIFPAWLVHAVQPNLTESVGRKGDRISISFNLYQRRLGSKAGNPHRAEVTREDLAG